MSYLKELIFVKVRVEGEVIEVKSVELKQDDDTSYYLRLIDQRILPHNLEFITTKSLEKAIDWIKEMAVRGAPAIGATGAFALVLGIQEKNETSSKLIHQLKDKIISSRPTAKDLDTFVSELVDFISTLDSYDLDLIAQKAHEIAKRSSEECKMIGNVSKSLIREGMGVLTHCNAGALATIDHGTALSTIRQAHLEGVKFKVYVDETRPRLQGMLTAWELVNEGIDHEIIVDNAAGFMMHQNKIQIVITGCDRVIRDGSVANKIGTLEKAVLAKNFDIPFYVAMPWTTYDPNLYSSEDIEIEYRSPNEVTHIKNINGSHQLSPSLSKATNPAFDITPSEFVSGYITKDGILTKEELYPNYLSNQSKMD